MIRYDSHVIGEAQLPSDPRGGDTVEITGLGEQLDLDPDNADSPEIELDAAGRKVSPTASKSCTTRSHQPATRPAR